MKTSFARPGTAPAAAQPAPATRPAPARPAPAAAQPAPATRPGPAPAARPAPAPATRPAPAPTTRPAPVAAAAPTTRPAPAARPAPATRPAPTAAPVVQQTAVAPVKPIGSNRASRRAAAQPELPLQPVAEETVVEVESQVVDEQQIDPNAEAQLAAENYEMDSSEIAQYEGTLAVPHASRGLLAVPLGQGSGEMGSSDFSFPHLKLCQYVGPLVEAGYTPGDYVFDDRDILWQPGCEPLEITILRYTKQFVEDLPYGSTEFPRIFNTSGEAEAVGLYTDYGPANEPPSARAQILCMILLRCPEGVSDEVALNFPVEFGDSLYALGMWRLAGASYKLIKTITGAQRTRLTGGLHTGSFRLSGQQIKGQRNTYWGPVLQPGETHPPELIEFIVANADA